MIDNLIDQLKRDEGVRVFPYKDSVGKLTIGVGRNLSDVGISEAEAELLLQNDINYAVAMLEQNLPWTTGLDAVRLAALTNMAFNMGIGGLLGFKQALGAMQAGDYKAAAEHFLDSKWAEQVGARAHRLALQIETGTWQ